MMASCLPGSPGGEPLREGWIWEGFSEMQSSQRLVCGFCGLGTVDVLAVFAAEDHPVHFSCLGASLLSLRCP